MRPQALQRQTPQNTKLATWLNPLFQSRIMAQVPTLPAKETPFWDAARAGAPTKQHDLMDAHACPPRQAQTPLPHQPERTIQTGRTWGSLSPSSSQQSQSSAPEGVRDAAWCEFITYLAPRPAGLSQQPSHAAPAPRHPGGCSSPPLSLGCPPGLSQSPSLRKWSSSAWADPLFV